MHNICTLYTIGHVYIKLLSPCAHAWMHSNSHKGEIMFGRRLSVYENIFVNNSFSPYDIIMFCVLQIQQYSPY